jgi:thiamine biosynthesis lipoprotein
MKHFRRPTTQRWLSGAAAGLVSLTASDRLLGAHSIHPAEFSAPQPGESPGRFGFAYDGVLGTSLDVRLDAPSARDARECEQRMLAEIDRLEKILSLYHPASEISRVKAGAPVESPELAAVLGAYDLWSARTGGALSPNLAGVLALWKNAGRTGRAPGAAALAAAFAAPLALNVDALGKGYIVDRAAAVARQFAPAGLLNIGGDIRAWGDRAWMIGVANPFDPADNAPPLTEFPLHDAAAATSGGYARQFTVGGRRYSHLVDPRTLQPLDSRVCATVVAADCLSANALSTAVCVLGAAGGASLARTYALDHLFVGAPDGGAGGGGFATIAPAAVGSTLDLPTSALAADNAWPAGYQMAVTVALKSSGGFRARRPYVAVWVENAEHKLVRTLTVWGTQGRYLPELTKWWHTVGGNRANISAATRATRLPGAYTLTWDGRDNRGQRVPQGDYTVFVEVNREHGHHVWESATLTCGRAPGTAELRDTAESDSGPVEYGPQGG